MTPIVIIDLEDLFFGAILLSNLEHYFEVNANWTAELTLDARLKQLVHLPNDVLQK